MSLGPLAHQLDQLFMPLLELALLLGFVSLYLVRTHEKRLLNRWKRAEEKGRRRSKPILGLFGRGSAEDRAIVDAEFVAVIGKSPRRYLLISLAIALGAAVMAIVLIGSWGLAIVAFIGLFVWRRGRASGKIARAAQAALAEQLIPYANQLANSLSVPVPLGQALSDLINSEREDTPLRRVLSRAVTRGRSLGLEIALRDEQQRTHSLALSEFLEILADGSTTLREPYMTARVLKGFVDVQREEQSLAAMIMTRSASARSTASMLLFMIPGLYFFQAMFVDGGSKMLTGTAGNILILVLAGLMALGMFVTGRTLRGLQKEN